MSEPAHNLSNSFLAVRLLALREFPLAADQGAGPFLVAQHAVAPDDPEFEARDFLLTRQGTWLLVDDFFRLPWDRRSECALFPSAADVMVLLEQLPPRPAVERLESEAEDRGDEPAHGDVFDAAILRALRGEDG